MYDVCIINVLLSYYLINSSLARYSCLLAARLSVYISRTLPAAGTHIPLRIEFLGRVRGVARSLDSS